MEIDFKLIGKRIKEERIRKGLTTERLSEEINITIDYLNKIERGSVEISLKRLARISTTLDIPIENLLTDRKMKVNDYLDNDLYNILIKCTHKKQRFLYNIAKIILVSDFV